MERNDNDATVETLTAEVRVLQVGSRRVTLSMFNQLDTVPWWQIELFGRVRPRDAYAETTLHLVGRDNYTDALVRATCY